MVRRLVALEETGRLGVEQVELAAGGLGVSSRTVWRWVRQAQAGQGLGRRPRGRFLVTDEIRQRFTFARQRGVSDPGHPSCTAKCPGLGVP